MENIEKLYQKLTLKGLEKRDFSRPFKEVGIRIEHIMPACFDAYVKIMHPWYLNINAPEKYFKEKTFEELYPDELQNYLFYLHGGNREKYDLFIQNYEESLRPYEEEKAAFYASIDPFSHLNLKEVTWKEVCQIYESHYHNELSLSSFDYKYKGFRYGLRQPQETTTPTKQSLRIMNVLKKHTKTEVLFVSGQGVQSRTIEDLQNTSFKNGLFGKITTHKQEWMFYTTHESVFAIIGGSYVLIDDLLDSDLEAIECTLLTRIDGYSDTINS